MRVPHFRANFINAARHVPRPRIWQADPPATFHFTPADAQRLFLSEGLRLPPATASTIANLVQTTAQPQELHLKVAPFEIHCRNSGLPSFTSLTKVIVIFGLRRLQRMHPNQLIDLDIAANDYFSLAEPRQARRRLDEILRRTEISVSSDQTQLIFSEDDREQSFHIEGPEANTLDGFALANRFLVELYKHFHCDVKKVSDFFGREPLQKIRYHLNKAGLQTSPSKEVAQFQLPRGLSALITAEAASDIRSRLLQIMADTDAMARHIGFADRVWLDEALARLTRDIVSEIFSVPAMQKIPHHLKSILISEAWHHLQNLMRKRVQMKEFTPGLTYEYRLNRALEKRLSLFPGNTLVFESKDFLPFAAKPWANAYLVPESFESILLQIPSLWLFGGESVFSPEDLARFASREATLDTLRDGGLRIFDQLKNLNLHFDAVAFKQRWQERFDKNPEAAKDIFDQEIDVTLEKFDFILRSHRLIIFGIGNHERQPLVDRVAHIKLALEKIKSDGLNPEENIAAFLTVIENIIDLTQYFRNIATLPRNWFRNPHRAGHLYQRLYGVRKNLGPFTLLGPMPRALRTKSIVFASLFIPNLTAEEFAKIPPSEHAFLVIDGPRTTHKYHPQMAVRDFFLNGFRCIEKAFAETSVENRHRIVAQYYENSRLLRLYLLNDGKNPVGVILNAESATWGGKQPTALGAMGEIAKKVFQAMGIARSHIVELNSDDESDANHGKMDLGQLREVILRKIEDSPA